MSQLSFAAVQQEEEIPEGEQNNLGHYIKVFLIGGKVVYFLVYLSLAMAAYSRLNRTFASKESFVISLYMLQMVWIVIFDFFLPHYIHIIFAMCALSNFSIFFVFKMLVDSKDVAGDSKVADRFKPIQAIIPTIYALCFAVSFIPQIGAYCSPRFTYPVLFNFMFLISLINQAFVIYYYKNGFMRRDYLPMQSESGPQGVNNTEIGSVSEDKSIKCYESQTKYFTIISTVASVLQFILGLVGLFFIEDSGSLSCSLAFDQSRSARWIYNTTWGNTFVTLHILVIIIQCASVNASLYKVPKSFGKFEQSKEESELRTPLVGGNQKNAIE